MPIEVFTITKFGTYHDREKTAEEMTTAYEEIVRRSGKIIAEHVLSSGYSSGSGSLGSSSGSGGFIESLYLVVDFPQEEK